MQHWLIKEEPEKYPFEQFLKDKKASWTKVTNYQARNNLREMKKGDLVFYYHSGKERQVVGIAKVIKEAYPNPNDDRWSWVDFAPVEELKNPVSLGEIKADDFFAEFRLVKQGRLSVVPVSQAYFDKILLMAEG